MCAYVSILYMSRFVGFELEGYMHRYAYVLLYICVHMYPCYMGLRGRARCVAPRASADVASADRSGRALAVGMKRYLGGLNV